MRTTIFVITLSLSLVSCSLAPSPRSHTIICKNSPNAYNNDVENFGDLICAAHAHPSKEDVLVLRDTVINYEDELSLHYTKDFTDIIVSTVNVLNFGRQHAFTTSVNITNEVEGNFHKASVDVVIKVPENEEVRLFVEVYGRSWVTTPDTTTSTWETTETTDSTWSTETETWDDSSWDTITFTVTPTTTPLPPPPQTETIICRNSPNSHSEDVENYGDLICVAHAHPSEENVLVLRDTLINYEDELSLHYTKEFTKLMVSTVNVLNFGAQHAFTTFINITNEVQGSRYNKGIVDVEIKVPENEEVRLFLEVYGRKH